jgi:hypothetical protein
MYVYYKLRARDAHHNWVISAWHFFLLIPMLVNMFGHLISQTDRVHKFHIFKLISVVVGLAPPTDPKTTWEWTLLGLYENQEIVAVAFV